ncbi:MAG: carboxypeptidase-like regulatory domain-containing protein, partial [Bacteroidota bacterium]|nr:carboxypeptidase-like regulatory domain-containing protein [Bacteroidota bacterium]
MKQFNLRVAKIIFFAISFFLSSSFLFAQNKIEGRITDVETQAPLEGVSVSVKNSKVGTSTNANGEFMLDAPKSSRLVVSYIGYEPKEIIATENNVSIQLNSTAKQLADVVVTALGVKKDVKRLGYSVQEVKGSDLTKARESNPINSLT